jgi:hypothetical protein
MTVSTLNKKRLSTYLNDHLGGATGGLELAKRTASNNEGTPYGAFLALVVEEIDEDRNVLMDVMERLEITKDPLKMSLGWAMEKLGRLKPNDQLLGYSPLSRLIELEGLVIGVTGKRALWTALNETIPDHPKLADIDFPALIERAERQRSGLEDHRRAAAREAFLDEDPGTAAAASGGGDA